MARTPIPKRGKPAAKPQGSPHPLSLRLPPELVADVDSIAQAEGRSRAKQIEMFLRQSVQSYRRRDTAA
jgi:hypothetical protein